MNNSATLRPTYSIIFIYDPTHEINIPERTGSELIISTSTCVSVGTLAEMDGDTTIRLLINEAEPNGWRAFLGVLETPGRQIAVGSATGIEFLRATVESNLTPLEVWINDSSEPDTIDVCTRITEHH